MKIVNIYLFSKIDWITIQWTQICRIAIQLIPLKLKRKRNLIYSEWTFLPGVYIRYYTLSRTEILQVNWMKEFYEWKEKKSVLYAEIFAEDK